MADQKFVDDLGLGMSTLFSTMGKTCADKFDTVVTSMSGNSTVNEPTQALLVDGFKLWCTCVSPDLRMEVLTKHHKSLYKAVEDLSEKDKWNEKDSDYKGPIYVAKTIAESLCTAGQMDQSQQLSSLFAPAAYQSIGVILSKAKRLDDKSPMNNKDTPYTALTELLQSLLRTMPFSGTIDLKNGFQTAIYPLLTQKQPPIPESLKNQATASMNSIMMVAKDCIVPYGKELIEIARTSNNSNLLIHFVSSPELYTNSKKAVVDNLDLFLKQTYMMYSSLFMNVSNDFPASLVPHLDFFVRQLTATPTMGSVTLLTLSNIANSKPNDVFPFLPTILSNSKFPQAEGVLAKLLGGVAKATVPDKAADGILKNLVELLESPASTLAHAGILVEISNITEFLSSKDVLSPYMPRIVKFKSASEIAYVKIDDFAAGRSLKKLTKRVDEMEAKILALNKKVTETCTNMADVIAYVDANMADMKDFLADIVKKLPNPKRLEVVGTLRKTLILHFECCRTGREFPIISYEWSKWLKMGFSLVKAGQAVIDLGMGNPLGILKKGVECVQEIYGAYKTNDDDEFNTYITQPFLTSAEQDQLLEKLRGQGFFDAFAYDSQRGGWYLLHPERDGKPPGGDAGGVTKVWTKEGYTILDSAKALAKDYIGEVVGEGTVEMAEAAVEMVSGKKEDAGSSESGNPEPTKSGASTSSSSGKPGARAAAMREQFGSSAQSAEEKVASANQAVEDRNRIFELESRVKTLEDRMTALEKDRATQSKGCCTIC